MVEVFIPFNLPNTHSHTCVRITDTQTAEGTLREQTIAFKNVTSLSDPPLFTIKLKLPLMTRSFETETSISFTQVDTEEETVTKRVFMQFMLTPLELKQTGSLECPDILYSPQKKGT